MHSNGVCHRDLKPENFLFSNHAPLMSCHLKIIDFGLACQFKPGEVLTQRVGTCLYVAPEVLDRSYNEQCDMWSLGCLLYLMLCGMHPFYARSDSMVLRRVRQGNVTFAPKQWQGVSEEAKCFIEKLVAKDPSVRYTAEQALNDEWIQMRTPRAKEASLGQNFMENLKSFQEQNLLKKAALNIIAGLIEDDQIKPLRDVFTSLDHNKDGNLSLNELSDGLAKAGLEQAPEDVEQLLQGADTDGSGGIDYTEFLAATMGRSLYLKELHCRAAFGMFDCNRDGKISSEELGTVLKIRRGDHKASKQRMAATLMQQVDLNGDNYIDFAEFMQMMRR